MKTAWQMWQKFGWKMGAVQSTANKPKRLQHSTFWDTFSDVVLTENCSAKIACYLCHSFCNVKNVQPKHSI